MSFRCESTCMELIFTNSINYYVNFDIDKHILTVKYKN